MQVREKRIIAAILALFFGALGIHKFYLGRTKAGIIQIVLSMCGVGAIIPLVEGIMYLVMSDLEFERKYILGDTEWF